MQAYIQIQEFDEDKFVVFHEKNVPDAVESDVERNKSMKKFAEQLSRENSESDKITPGSYQLTSSKMVHENSYKPTLVKKKRTGIDRLSKSYRSELTGKSKYVEDEPYNDNP